jgi:nitroreductase
MNTIEAILNRRSIRKYTDKPVDKEVILQLLKAGMYAPSARNSRAWQFVVIQNREMLNQLSQLHPYGKMLREAACAILVCGDRNIDKEEGYLAINCAAATQNIMLSAHELGLGSVWLGVYPRQERMKEISEFLQLPEHLMPVSLISLGYPAEKRPFPERFELEKIIWK